MGKTYVEVMHDVPQENVKAGSIGYIDGYVSGGSGSPCAVIVVGEEICLCSTHLLRALPAPPAPKEESPF